MFLFEFVSRNNKNNRMVLSYPLPYLLLLPMLENMFLFTGQETYLLDKELFRRKE
ncbi:MAG: hypothetical protein WCL18_03985 [bacterium]